MNKYISDRVGAMSGLLLIIVLAILMFPINQASADEASISTLKKLIAERFDGLEITELTPSPVDGVYELVSQGQIFYISENADHLFTGALIEVQSRTDLTAARKGKVHVGLINQIEEKDMLIYEPTIEAQGTLTIFTDTSCPYCSKLHEEIDELLVAGIRVRYLMFPRAGLGSGTHQELESVWCASDPHQAMTDAKAGAPIDSATCENPIETHMSVAESVGLRGTPFIFLDDGRSIPGYRSAKELVALVKESDKL